MAPPKPKPKKVKVIESRRLARELALQMLFQAEIGKVTVEELESDFLSRQEEAGEKSREFALGLTRGTLTHRAEIDERILSVLDKWTLPSLSTVDRNVLRLGCYELIYGADIPPRVTINEAIDLAKKFGTEESGGFVNGILDQIKNRYSPKSDDDPSGKPISTLPA